MEAPTDVARNIPISLEQRAPIGPIPTRTWNMYLSLGLASIEYSNLLEQKNSCIRSQLAHVSLSKKFGAHSPFRRNFEATSRTTRFPYPAAFQKLFSAQMHTQVTQERVYGIELDIMAQILIHIARSTVTSPVLSNEALDENLSGDLADNAPPGQDILAQEEAGFRANVHAEQVQWEWGITSPWWGITHTSAIEWENQVQPTYVVLGIFSHGHYSPKERVAFIIKPEKLFWELRWATFRLRGLSTLLSLRQVKGFRLYRCNAQEGTHERIHLDSNGVADLQLLLQMYKRWYVPRHIALAWANWIHQTLNNGSYDILDGTYSVELVLDWSVTRISIVVFLPVLLSLAIGLWINSDAWTDLATIQTAWGTASYIVTAGGLLAALLAIISSIADK